MPLLLIKLGYVLEYVYKHNKLPQAGLCDSISFYTSNYWERLMLFHPTLEDQNELENAGLNTFHWGSESSDGAPYQLTDLRATILCFLMVIDEEDGLAYPNYRPSSQR